MSFFEDRKDKSQQGVVQHWCLPRQQDLGDLRHTLGNKIKLNYIHENMSGILSLAHRSTPLASVLLCISSALEYSIFTVIICIYSWPVTNLPPYPVCNWHRSYLIHQQLLSSEVGQAKNLLRPSSRQGNSFCYDMYQGASKDKLSLDLRHVIIKSN